MMKKNVKNVSVAVPESVYPGQMVSFRADKYSAHTLNIILGRAAKLENRSQIINEAIALRAPDAVIAIAEREVAEATARLVMLQDKVKAAFEPSR